MELEDYETQIRVLGDWLSVPRDVTYLTRASVEVWLARAQHLGGSPEAALATLEPLAGSQYGGEMYRRALVLLGLGRESEAEAEAWNRFQRYPITNSVELLSYIYWRTGQFERAAALLASPPRSLTLSEWHENIAPQFFHAFEEAETEEVSQAFYALVRAGIPPYHLQYLPGRFGLEGQPERAFEMFDRMKIPGIGKFWAACQAYSQRKAWQGREAALAWLGAKFQPGLRRNLSVFCHESGDYEVAWELMPDPVGDSPLGKYAWLMRAAGWTKSEGDHPEWEERLHAHYTDRGETFYDHLARHLLGLTSVEEVWSRV